MKPYLTYIEFQICIWILMPPIIIIMITIIVDGQRAGATNWLMGFLLHLNKMNKYVVYGRMKFWIHKDKPYEEIIKI